MALTEHYLTSTKKLGDFLEALHKAKPPERMTRKFIENLGFKSTADRLFINMLKEIGFLNDSGNPTDRYFKYLDRSESGKVLATGIQEAYEDLFDIDKEAYKLGKGDVKNKLKTLLQGSKSDDVFGKMASTFKALVDLADFSNSNSTEVITIDDDDDTRESEYREESDLNDRRRDVSEIINKSITTEMHYNIQIHLPETTDIEVYNAIFKALKTHLL